VARSNARIAAPIGVPGTRAIITISTAGTSSHEKRHESIVEGRTIGPPRYPSLSGRNTTALGIELKVQHEVVRTSGETRISAVSRSMNFTRHRFLDVLMPDLDGFGVHRENVEPSGGNENRPPLPLDILVTAHDAHLFVHSKCTL